MNVMQKKRKKVEKWKSKDKRNVKKKKEREKAERMVG